MLADAHADLQYMLTYSTWSLTCITYVLGRSERTKRKVVISTGMPDALRELLGGEAAVRAMLASVPPAAPSPAPPL